MVEAKAQVRYDVTFQCPVCAHTDTVEVNKLPSDGIVECDECDEEIRLVYEESEEPRPFWKRWRD